MDDIIKHMKFNEYMYWNILNMNSYQTSRNFSIPGLYYTDEDAHLNTYFISNPDIYWSKSLIMTSISEFYINKTGDA